MLITEAQKRANLKWDKAHMTVVGVKVTRKVASDFTEACRVLGKTKGEVLRQAIVATLEQVKEGGE